MKQNRPIRKITVKRSPDVRKQINEAAKVRQNQFGEEVKFLQEQLNAGDDRIETLKDRIISEKRSNNGLHTGLFAGVIATNLIFLSGGGSPIDSVIKYGIALSVCTAGLLMNRHFNKTDITLTEMLKRTNAWSRQEFTPEEVQTFKELYDEVKMDLEENPKLRGQVKSSFVHIVSQGAIFSLSIACFASAMDKLGYSALDKIQRHDNSPNIELSLDPNDPFLKTSTELRFTKFDR